MIHVLIVEDDRLVLAGLAAGLEERDYLVTKAVSGEQAVQLADSARPDLVLMDICLPDISGIEAARKINDRLGIPIIFLSAFNAEETVREAVRLGGFVYLVKPITIKQLVPAIESVLARAGDLSKLRGSEQNLATALKQSREISVAIGMLMERHGISAEDAFELLRRNARDTRRKAAEVAQEVISGSPGLGPPS